MSRNRDDDVRTLVRDRLGLAGDEPDVLAAVSAEDLAEVLGLAWEMGFTAGRESRSEAPAATLRPHGHDPGHGPRGDGAAADQPE